MESNSSTDDPGVVVGKLGKPNGLEGFLGLYAEPEDLGYFDPGSTVHIDDHPYTVRALREGKKGPQVAFEGIADRHRAEEIRGREIRVARRRELGEGEFWPADLVGLEVRPNGGRVVAVNHGPTQDRLVVERGDARFEVPFVDHLVPVVDIEEGFVEIAEIEGLSSPPDRP